MGLHLQIVFIITSAFTLFFIIRKIRKHRLNIEDAVVWVIWALFLILLSIFTGIPEFIADKLGFMTTSNFIFSLFIFFLYIVVFFQAISISQLKEKQKDLIQKLSIKEYEERKRNEE